MCRSRHVAITGKHSIEHCKHAILKTACVSHSVVTADFAFLYNVLNYHDLNKNTIITIIIITFAPPAQSHMLKIEGKQNGYNGVLFSHYSCYRRKPQFTL